MGIRNFRRAVASALAAGGLLWSGSTAMALVHDVGDPSFEEIGLGTADFYYFQGPPNSPFWNDHSGSTGKNRAYDTFYGTSTFPEFSDPRTGNQAVDGEGAYNYQVLEDTFVAGRTYAFTMYTQGHADASTDDNDRLWLYLFAGVDGTVDEDTDEDEAPGDEGAAGTMDGSSIFRATFHQDGTIDGIAGVGTGTQGFLPFTGFVRSADSDWTRVGFTYTASAADEGKRIGLGFWANDRGSVDDVALTSTVQPGDYDADGDVDEDDFETWRFGFGSTTNLAADGNHNSVVDAADYAVWRDNVSFGSGGGAGLSGVPVPEPQTLSLGVLALVAAGAASRRRRA